MLCVIKFVVMDLVSLIIVVFDVLYIKWFGMFLMFDVVDDMLMILLLLCFSMFGRNVWIVWYIDLMLRLNEKFYVFLLYFSIELVCMKFV